MIRARTLLLALMGVAVVVAAVLVWRWPFTEQRVLESLMRSTKCDLRVEGFRMHFFPRPGCTLEKPVFTRSSSGPPVGVAERIEMRTSWVNLITFRKRLSLLRVDKLHITLNRPVPAAVEHGGNGPQNTIAELVADGAVLDVNGLHFEFPQLTLTELGAASAIGFTTVIDAPHPPGRIRSRGSVGPFVRGNISTTPASGLFEVLSGDLSRYPKLGGSLTAKGEFNGTLGDLATKGETKVSGFEVNENQHPTDLAVSWDARVNSLKGDLRFNSVEADFERTHLSLTGSIQDKVVRLDADGQNARLEDLAQMVTSSGTSALQGPIQFSAHVEVPHGDAPFLKRLRVDGKFSVAHGHWRRATTQEKVDELSARARKEKKQAESHTAARVPSDLSGTVHARDGIARLPHLAFQVPGASATGSGTYNLLTKFINVQGEVTMKAEVSEAASGIKSVLLKPFNRLFRKRSQDEGATLPVEIVGQVPHPRYRVKLTKQ